MEIILDVLIDIANITSNIVYIGLGMFYSLTNHFITLKVGIYLSYVAEFMGFEIHFIGCEMHFAIAILVAINKPFSL